MNVSVVIPVYNEEKYIGACLESLKNQTEKPYEIILVDNNCTDKTVSIAQEYDIKIVKEQKQGMIFARNTGFDKAQGNIIARCDADTVIPGNWISKIKKKFRNGQIDGLTGIVLYKKSSFPFKLYSSVLNRLFKQNILAGPNMAITKKVWNKVRNEVCLDESKVHEDIDLSIHIAEYGEIRYDPELKVYSSIRRWRHNPLSFFFEYPLRLISTIRAHKK